MLFSAYKVYAEVLRNRLEKETEDRNFLPGNQYECRNKGWKQEEEIVEPAVIEEREEKEGEGKEQTGKGNSRQESCVGELVLEY